MAWRLSPNCWAVGQAPVGGCGGPWATALFHLGVQAAVERASGVRDI